MKKPNMIIKITKEDTGYSANSLSNEYFIATESENFEELKASILEAVNLSFEEKGFVYDIDEIQFEYDLESFLIFKKL
jgi:hypothetical protein